MSESTANVKRMQSGERLVYWAIIASLVLHLLAFGGYEEGKRHKWWQKTFLPRWLKSVPLVVSELKKKQPPKPPPQQQETPLLFVDVDPAAATTEAPKNAKYYSSKNSQAANQAAKADTDTPNIEGSQTHVAKTADAPRAKPVPLQPAPSKPEPEQPVAKESQPDPKPQGGPQVGDLALAKPMDKPGETQAKEIPKAVHKRPNTIVEAQTRNEIAGQKMKQPGGVRRLSIDGLDTKATTYGEYDGELIRAIQDHWYDLLDRRDFSRDRTGKVVLEFDLGFDGRVTNLHVIENDVDELLCYVCQRAVMDPMPFAPWPSDMRREIAADKREVRFTFFYE